VILAPESLLFPLPCSQNFLPQGPGQLSPCTHNHKPYQNMAGIRSGATNALPSADGHAQVKMEETDTQMAELTTVPSPQR
jgi:hypothetical protein